MFLMDKHHDQMECESPPESTWKVQELCPLETYKHIREHKEEVKGDWEDVFLNLAQSIHNKFLYFAAYDSMKGRPSL